jgi:hypothetical protein
MNGREAPARRDAFALLLSAGCIQQPHRKIIAKAIKAHNRASLSWLSDFLTGWLAPANIGSFWCQAQALMIFYFYLYFYLIVIYSFYIDSHDNRARSSCHSPEAPGA